MLNGGFIGQVSGVLFDKDGTLLNSEAYLFSLAKKRIYKAVEVFMQLQSSESEIEKLKSLLHEIYGVKGENLSPSGCLAIASRQDNLLSTATVFCLLGKDWPLSMSLANKVFSSADVIENQKKYVLNKQTILPGALNFLNKLKGANVTIGLISNDTCSGIQKFLHNHNLQETISSFWSADHFPKKPDPFAVEGLCKELGIEAKQCALIGDADSDIEMANAAGIGISLGYLGGWTQPPKLNSQPHLIKHWDDLSLEEP